MSGELPLLSLRISDDKLRSVVALVESIPLPESRSAARTASSSTTKVTAGTKNENYLTEIRRGKEIVSAVSTTVYCNPYTFLMIDRLTDLVVTHIWELFFSSAKVIHPPADPQETSEFGRPALLYHF